VHPKIAVSAPLFSMLPLEEMLERIEKEFSIWEFISEGNCRLIEVRDRLKEFLENSKLRFSVHGPISDINLGSLNPAMRKASKKELVENIKIAGELGIGPVTLHIGFLSPLTILYPDKTRALTRASLKSIDALATEYGIKIGVENMPRTKWSVFVEPWELVQATEGTDLGFCFDIGHANITGNIDEFMPLADRFVNIHIHDNHGKWDEHLILGKGNIELQKLVNKLKGKYKGNWVLECNKLDEGVKSRSTLEKWLKA
jgi:sugar phosphate isomerase/epimerase